jgi:hypothetical protein
MKPSVHLQEIAAGRRWVGHCTDGPQPGCFIRSGCGDFWVGRSPDSEIVLAHQSVSRRHAVLRVIDARLYCNDLHSRNGTRVNDAPVRSSGFPPRPDEPPLNWMEIRPADRLAFAEVAVRVLWVGEGTSPFTPAHLAWNDGAVVKMAAAVLDGGGFRDLPVLADALQEAGCTCAVALAEFRRGDKSAVAEHLLELLLGRTPPATAVDSRTMARCPLPPHMPESLAWEDLRGVFR